MRQIHWHHKLQRMLRVMAYALGIATLQYAFMPERPYGPPVAYSLAIAIITWAVIDIGCELLPSAHETGWPKAWQGVLLVAGGIATGFFLGSAIADLACRTFGWYQNYPVGDRSADLRNSILITVLAGVIGSYFFYSRSQSQYLENKMAEARQQASEARLKLLESQLEPHMLFNTLANLRALIGVDPARAQGMLDHMVAYLRATLDASRTTAHPLATEFERLQDYLALMAVRMGPRLRYTLDLPPELARLPVPTLLLQPLVENCIQHGLEPKVEGGSISVQARRTGPHLVLDVIDTGVGPGAADTQGSGFGLAQVRERLATAYDQQATLALSAGPQGGTQVRITFPYPA